MKQLFLAPFMGLAFALFLPFVALTMVAGALFKKIGIKVYDAAFQAAVFNWRPSEAYLANKPPKKEDK